ncbi:TSUP family transporter [Gemella bergeri]
MSLVVILLGLLSLAAVYYVVIWAQDIIKNWSEPDNSNPILGFVIGIITNFFDVLGIGNFSTITLASQLTGFIKNDRLLPGMLNIASVVPVLIEAFLFISNVEVGAVTLLSLIIAAVVGALVGGRIVTKLPEYKIQIVMGFALLITAFLMFAKKVGWLALLGENNTAVNLTGIALIIGIVGNIIFGALMMAGVGLYAPCLAMVSLLGLNPKVAFPIMMGSCVALMAMGSPKFIKEGMYPRKGTLGLAIGGIVGVFIGYQFVKSLSVDSLIWIIIVVVIYTGIMMLRKGIKNH